MFCKAPFCYLGLNAGGIIQPCCINSLAVDNIDHRSLHDIWFGHEYSRLRESMNSDSPCYYYCLYCNLHRSEAICHARSYDSFIINKNGYPSFLKFSGSNRCNLKCAMCNEVYSSQFTGYEVSNFLYKDYLDQLDEFIPHLHTVSLSGGEPLLIKQYWELIKKIKTQNSDTTIHITTNGTVCSDVLCSLLNDEKVFVTISLDSVNKDTYSSIRKNANYESVMKNLDKFQALSCNLDVNICLTTLNLSSLPETLEFLCKRGLMANIIAAKHPMHLSLYFAPSSVDALLESVKSVVDAANPDAEMRCNSLSASRLLGHIVEYRGKRDEADRCAAERQRFSTMLSTILCNSSSKSKTDIEQIILSLPLRLFTPRFSDSFFVYNSPLDIAKLAGFDNNTIQDFIISNAFYLSN